MRTALHPGQGTSWRCREVEAVGEKATEMAKYYNTTVESDTTSGERRLSCDKRERFDTR